MSHRKCWLTKRILFQTRSSSLEERTKRTKSFICGLSAFIKHQTLRNKNEVDWVLSQSPTNKLRDMILLKMLLELNNSWLFKNWPDGISFLECNLTICFSLKIIESFAEWHLLYWRGHPTWRTWWRTRWGSGGRSWCWSVGRASPGRGCGGVTFTGATRSEIKTKLMNEKLAN